MKTKCNHTPEPEEPEGYVAWFAWAEKKLKTHKQIQCPHCKKWAIWVEREEDTVR